MSLITSITARLKTAGTPFKEVAGAAEFSAIEKRRRACPAAYVMVAEEAGGDNTRATGGVLQQLETDIAVVIVTQNLSDGRMAAAVGDIEVLKDWCRTQLIGFQPDGSEDALILISGKLLKARSGTLWFEELYGTTSYLESQS
ncbi:MAG: hypothetical protein ABJQ71_15115 [Roseibium sp.]